jgi:hypothetical protein
LAAKDFISLPLESIEKVFSLQSHVNFILIKTNGTVHDSVFSPLDIFWAGWKTSIFESLDFGSADTNSGWVL